MRIQVNSELFMDLKFSIDLDRITRFDVYRGNTPGLSSTTASYELVKTDSGLCAIEPMRNTVQTKEHPLIQIISEYVVPLGKGKGPGVARMSLNELTDMDRALSLLHDGQQLEIILPNSVGISDTMMSVLRDANNRHRSEVRRKGAGEERDMVVRSIYSDENSLKTILKRSPAPGVKRIVITDKAPEDKAGRKRLLKLVADNAALFNDTRLLNVLLPEDYSSLKEDDKTFHQARIMMIAILARLLEKDDNTTRIMLRAMLDGYINDDVNKFIENLAKGEDSWSVSDRIKYFLGKTISLIPQLVKEFELLKLRMKTFWVAA